MSPDVAPSDVRSPKTRSRGDDLSSELFGREFAYAPKSPGITQTTSRIQGARVDWLYSRSPEGLSGGNAWRTHQLQMASDGVLDGSPSGTLSSVLASDPVRQPRPAHDTSHMSDPKRTFQSSQPMLDAIAPGGADEEAERRSSLQGRLAAGGPEEPEVAEYVWVRIDGLPHTDVGERLRELSIALRDAGEHPVVVWRPAMDTLSLRCKGFGFAAFVAEGYAHVAGAVHELRTRGLTVVPTTHSKASHCLD